MKQKAKVNLIFLALLITMVLLIGCRDNKNTNPTATPKLTQPVNTAPITSIIPTIIPTSPAITSPEATATAPTVPETATASPTAQ